MPRYERNRRQEFFFAADNKKPTETQDLRRYGKSTTIPWTAALANRFYGIGASKQAVLTFELLPFPGVEQANGAVSTIVSRRRVNPAGSHACDCLGKQRYEPVVKHLRLDLRKNSKFGTIASQQHFVGFTNPFGGRADLKDFR